MKKLLISVLAVFLSIGYLTTVQAQNDISNIFKAGVVDLNKVAEGYLKPAGNSFSSGLGAGWYNTAAVHKPWGFDLTIGVGVVSAPQSDQTFSLTGLTNLQPTVAGTTSAPTFTGKGNGVELNLMHLNFCLQGNLIHTMGVKSYPFSPLLQYHNMFRLPVSNLLSVFHS